jgi:hypothetical protein
MEEGLLGDCATDEQGSRGVGRQEANRGEEGEAWTAWHSLAYVAR